MSRRVPVLLIPSFLDFCKDFLCALCLLCSPPTGRELTAEAQRAPRSLPKDLRVLCVSAVSSLRLRPRRAVLFVPFVAVPFLDGNSKYSSQPAPFEFLDIDSALACRG